MTSRTSALKLLLVATCAAVLLAACGGASALSGSTRLAVPASQILDFSGPTLDGGTLDASTLADKPTVFWFWAPWCTVCRAEAPGVERVAEKYGNQVHFVGIPGRGEVSAMKQFVSDTGITSLTHVADLDNSLWKRFGVTSQPSFAFVGSDGSVNTIVGGLTATELDRKVSELVDK